MWGRTQVRNLLFRFTHFVAYAAASRSATPQNPDGYGLIRRRAALFIVMVEWYQRVRLRIIRGDGSSGDVIRNGGESVEAQVGAAREGCFNVDDIAVLDPKLRQIVFIHEHHVASAKNTSIPVIRAVDGRVVLIVAANGREYQALFGNRSMFIERWKLDELSPARCCLPDPLRRWQRQAEAAGTTDS